MALPVHLPAVHQPVADGRNRVAEEVRAREQPAILAVEAKALTKTYGDLVALEPLDLVIPDGQRVVLVGHNGSGKTTFLRMAARMYSFSFSQTGIAWRKLVKPRGAKARYVSSKRSNLVSGLS